jgi:hypothetical protein
MLPEGFIASLKAYKFSVMGRDSVIKVFPELLANTCRTMQVTNMYGVPQGLCYDWNKLMEFKVNLSTAIAMEKYDTLDNIIIEFFDSYNYKIVTPMGQLVMFKVDFPKESKRKFETTCNAFKGRLWDDIIDEFVTSFYEFANTATIHGDNLAAWH